MGMGENWSGIGVGGYGFSDDEMCWILSSSVHIFVFECAESADLRRSTAGQEA